MDLETSGEEAEIFKSEQEERERTQTPGHNCP
jgi:hypothetical protein